MPRNNNVEILYHVVARHIVLIFNCFKGLQKLSADQQESIVYHFLEKVIESQGWKNEGINAQQLRDATMLKAYINYETSHFAMKTTEEINPPVNIFQKFSLNG